MSRIQTARKSQLRKRKILRVVALSTRWQWVSFLLKINCNTETLMRRLEATHSRYKIFRWSDLGALTLLDKLKHKLRNQKNFNLDKEVIFASKRVLMNIGDTGKQKITMNKSHDLSEMRQVIRVPRRLRKARNSETKRRA